MSTNRHEGKAEADLARDALAIWDGGACNPRAIARVIVDMIDWYVANKGGSDGVRGRAPLALAQGQLLYLMGFGLGDVPGNTYTPGELHRACVDMVAQAEVTS